MKNLFLRGENINGRGLNTEGSLLGDEGLNDMTVSLMSSCSSRGGFAIDSAHDGLDTGSVLDSSITLSIIVHVLFKSGRVTRSCSSFCLFLRVLCSL